MNSDYEGIHGKEILFLIPVSHVKIMSSSN